MSRDVFGTMIPSGSVVSKAVDYMFDVRIVIRKKTHTAAYAQLERNLRYLMDHNCINQYVILKDHTK